MIRAALMLLALPALAEERVTATSQGYLTRCAEMDNVLVALENPNVMRFTIRATPPAYLAGREGDSMAPDFTDCVFPDEPIWDFEPFTVTLYEDDRILLRGHREVKSWRPEVVDFTVGERTVSGLHLTQLFVKLDGRFVEVLVLYSVDGYWRPRPLPPVDREETGFGSSLLVGPIEVDRRPLVRMTEVVFDPETLSYTLRFARGGEGVVRLVSARRGETRLEVSLGAAVTDGPFAMLSSMHVTPDNADVSRVSAREGALWRSMAIDALETVEGLEFDFGRDIPSRHNYSAPDVIFGPFEAR
jgi:hypothetical protein